MKQRKITKKLLADFRNSMKNDEKSENTIEKYMRDVQRFAVFADSRNIDKNLTIEYKLYLGENYAPSSANSMIAAMNSLLRFAGWHDICVKQFKIQAKTYCSEQSELTKAEYISLVRTAEAKKDKRLSLLIQTICATGIRVSEISFITVEAVREGEAVVSCKGKTRKVFIVKELRRKLLRFAESRGIVKGMIFITKNGNALNRSNIWREMKSLCMRAGVMWEKVFPHNLRHLFARTFYGIEKDIAKLADILGHSSINTTRIYFISTGEEHRRKMENMHLVI